MDSKFFNKVPGKLAKETANQANQNINILGQVICQKLDNNFKELNQDINGLAQILVSEIETVRETVTSNEDRHKQELRAFAVVVIVLNLLVMAIYLLVK